MTINNLPFPDQTTKKMNSVHIYFTLAVLLMDIHHLVQSTPLPSGCNHKTSSQIINEDKCTYGTTKDSCGNVQCMKGPSETCGGKFGRYGTCADGLMCSNCNRCQGCSFKTFICWDDRNCIW